MPSSHGAPHAFSSWGHACLLELLLGLTRQLRLLGLEASLPSLNLLLRGSELLVLQRLGLGLGFWFGLDLHYRVRVRSFAANGFGFRDSNPLPFFCVTKVSVSLDQLDPSTKRD